MKIAGIVLCCGFVTLAWAQGRSQEFTLTDPESVGMSSERLLRIDPVVQAYIDNGSIAGAVTFVSRHGRVVQHRAYGYADLEARKEMQTDTIVRMFSMTKQITAVAVLMLYEEGYFNLFDPVSKYIPEFANPQVLVPCDEGVADCEGEYKLVPAHREITIQHLLSHTSGITYIFNDRPFLAEIYKNAGVTDALEQTTGTVGEMVHKLAPLPLYGHPGEIFEYGLNMDVLGYFVEVLTGKNLGQFCQERIFGPLGMKDTYFWLPPEKLERLSAAYSWDDQGRLFRMPDGHNVWNEFYFSPDFNYNGPQTFYSGGAGTVSTAADYAKMLMMLANDGVYEGRVYLGRKTVELMRTDHKGDIPGALDFTGHGYGLGPAVLTNPAEANRLGSPGLWRWAGLFNTWYQVDPQEGLISMILMQLWPSYDMDLYERFDTVVHAAIIDSPGRPIQFKK